MDVLPGPHSAESQLSNSKDDVNVFENPTARAAGRALADNSQALAARFRALFVLRNLKCDASVRYIAQCFNDSSALLKHELAYCLGQMQNHTAIPYLISVLEDMNQESIVRHEAGEALAAIGDPSVIKVLSRFVADTSQEVAETCQLALKRLQWLHSDNTENARVESVYNSVDPAPASPNTKDIEDLTKILVDESLSLWERYKAMFTLRNLSSEEDHRAVKAIAQGLKCANSGALFRHEIAYVLGQIQSPAVIPELSASLCDKAESPMVRHECAEALGSIATPECMDLINKYTVDGERIVRESCEVALDMAEYEQSNEFQYATFK